MTERIISYNPRLDCPTAEELIDYREGKTNGERDDVIRHHLTMCTACVDTLLIAARVSEPVPLEPLPRLSEILNTIARQGWEKVNGKRAAGAAPR